MFEKYSDMVEPMDPIKYTGTVKQVKGLLIESHGPQVVVGESCQIVISGQEKTVGAEVIGFNGTSVQMMAFDQMEGIEPGCQVIAMGEPLTVPVSDKLKGRVLNAMGKPIDGKGSIGSAVGASTNNTPPNVLFRKTIEDRMITGVRSIDAMTPVGKGQRIGIFSGSGVGKSTLLGMTARNTAADVNVIALIGERGREVREFIEQDLGEEGLKRSVLVVSTSDTSPLARVRGAFVATAIAEYFRDQGQDVALMMDSLTRFSMAQREIGLAVGEPPVSRGYTPSVFAAMPKLLERAGNSDVGSITGLYTVLVEGDDFNEPISDAVRGILDGHIVLSRKLASKGHFPAIDVLDSISRVMPDIINEEHLMTVNQMKEHISIYKEAEDLINIGA